MSWIAKVKDNAQHYRGAQPTLHSTSGGGVGQYIPFITAPSPPPQEAEHTPARTVHSLLQTPTKMTPPAYFASKANATSTASAATAAPSSVSMGSLPALIDLSPHHHPHASSAPAVPTTASSAQDISLVLGDRTPHQRNYSSASSVSRTVREGESAVADARHMDPFIGQEHKIADALHAVRRDASAFAVTALETVKVVVPGVKLLLQPPQQQPNTARSSGTPAEVSLTPVPTAGSSKRPPLSLPPPAVKQHTNQKRAVSPSDSLVSMDTMQSIARALSEQSVVSSAPRTIRLSELRGMTERLAQVVSSRSILGRPTTSENRKISLTPKPTLPPSKTSSSSKGKITSGAPSPSLEEDGSSNPLPPMSLPQFLVDQLSEVLSVYQRMIRKKSAGFDTLLRLNGGDISPHHYSRGLSLAARELAAILSQPRFSKQSIIAGICELDEAVSPPCGDFMMRRVVEGFGKCDVSKVSCYVIYGQHDAKKTAQMWLLKAAQDSELSDSPSLIFSKPNRFVVGVGWQRHAVAGAVTVCLAAPWFDELQFTQHHGDILPMQELLRSLTSGCVPKEETMLFPIKCEIARYQIQPVSPTVHPVYYPAHGEVQILLRIPITVDVACTVVQADAPPQTPFYGRRAEDTIFKNTRRRGRPGAIVPQEPKYSTHTSLIDYLPGRDGLTRITVRPDTDGTATVHIFARLSPYESSFSKAMSISIEPESCYSIGEVGIAADQRGEDEDGEGKQYSPALPVTTEVFNRWRCCLVSPMHDLVEEGVSTTFEAVLPSGIETCVIKGAHGQTAMLAIDTEATNSSVGRTPGSDNKLSTSREGGASISASSVSPNRRPSRMQRYIATVTRPVEGPLALWADGFMLCQWTVRY